ncbi:retention module-containing protein [Citrobacter portucalensis]|uniref:retention module-containing protein n=6 Tax=Citrobacter TaxID=544 RepID=UPI001F1B026E
MSKLLGVIKAIIGQVYVVDANGAQRLVHEGDRVYSGEEIVTGASGAVSISLPDGKTLDIGRNSHWGEHGLQVSHHPESSAQDIAAAQKAIADGADPTQVLEATAAGNEAPVTLEGGGGGHTLVQLELTGQVVDPTAGFNTKGLGSPNWDINLPIGGVTAGSASVFPPEVQITEFAGNDGFINKSEFHQTHLSGTSNQNHITLTFTDSQKNTFTVTVPVSNGHWNIDTDLGGLVPGNVTVVAIATDVTGRTAESFDHALIDITGPHIDITVDNVTPDNLINYEESRQPQTLIHGSVGGDTKPGDIVTLLVDGKEYTGVVTDPGNGTLTYTIPVLTQGLLHDPNIHATLTSTDDAGNTTIVSTDHHVDNDLYAQNAVTIETVANDDVVNANEFRMPTIISGIASGDAKAGDPVTLTIQGKAFHGTVFDDHGQLRYEIVVPSATLNEGANDVQVTLVSHDAVGNEATAVTHRTVVLDTQAANAISIDTVAGDNVVNRSESRMPTLISGAVTGDAQPGDNVAVAVNGRTFTGLVVTDEHGALRYEVAVDSSVLTEGSNNVEVTVTGVDTAGNTAVAVQHTTVVLDTQAANAISIDTVAGDNVVNRSESRMPTLISGAVTGDAQPGDNVAVAVNGRTFTGLVVTDEHGTLRYEVAVDSSVLTEGSNNVEVTVTGVDTAGNTAVAVQHTTVVLDTQAANAISIDTVAGDNVVNRSESRMPTLISGAVTGDAQPGDNVAVAVNGRTFTGLVVTDEHGALRYEVAVDSSVLTEGSNNVEVTVTGVDTAGNTAVAVQHTTVVLDTQAANAISIDTVAGDNVVNRSESRMPTLISGAVTGDAQPGDNVAVAVNGRTFTGLVVTDEHGALRYEVAVDSSVLTEGSNNVEVTVTGVDTAGNTAVAVQHTTVVLDTQAANAISIDTVAGDNVVNRSESRMPTLISGAVTGDAQPGDNVAVAVNGRTFTGLVVTDEHGALRYEVAVDSSVLTEGSNNVEVTVTGVDTAGNTAVAVQHTTVVLDTQAANAISIDTVAGDNVVNRSESRMPTLISGAVTGDAQPGDNVAVAVNGRTFTGLVVTDEHGALRYEVAVDSSVLTEGSNNVEVTVTGVDTAGNTAVAVQHTTVVLDTQAANAISIDTVAGDNVVNRSESRMPTLISGAVIGDAQPGDNVAVAVNGRTFTGLVVTDEHGALRYEVAVDSSVLTEGSNNVEVTVTGVDTAGNTAVAVQHTTVVLDTQAANAISIDTVAGDNVVNRSESRMPTLISGAVTGDAQPGDNVAVAVNGRTFTGLVVTDEHGALRYEVAVDSSVLTEGSNNVEVTVTGVDTAGNTAVAVQHTTVVLDTQAANAISIDTVAGDNVVNRSESRMPTLISGAVTGDAQPGDNVAVAVNGRTFTGLVVTDEHGALRYEVAVDSSVLTEGSNNVEVTVTGVDTAGNTAVAVQHTTVVLDTQAANAISIDTVAGDNVVNRSESRMPTLISGAVTGDAQPGDNVAVAVNGRTFTGLVVTDEHGALRYEVAVDSSVLTEGSNNVEVTVTGVDTAGNTAVAVQHTTVVLDTQAANAISIDTVAGDNVVNRSESRMPTLISGAVTGDAQPGDNVAVAVNGRTFTGLVVTDEHGALRYEVAVDSSVLTEGSNNVEVTVTGVDTAGNTAVAVQHTTVVLDTKAHNTVNIHDVTADNTLNFTELSAAKQVITGNVRGEDAKAGDPVQVEINGHQYHGQVIDTGKNTLGYRIEVDSDAFSDNQGHVLKEVTVHVSVTSHDAAGNLAIATSSHDVHIDNFAENTVHIDTVANDNVVNAIENRMTTLISGVAGGDAKAGDAVTVSVRGQSFTGTVVDDNGELRYEVAVPVGTLKEGKNAVVVTLVSHDAVGNEVTALAHRTVVLDTKAHNTVNIHDVTADNTLNFTELSAAKQVITGNVRGEDAKAGDPVLVEINGYQYHGQVIDTGKNTLGYRIEVDSAAFSDNVGHVLKEATVHVSVTSHDAAGNMAIATSSHDVHIDNFATNQLSIDTVATEDVVNAIENHMTTLISGAVGGDASVNDPVTVSVQGQDFTGKVVNINGELRYEVAVPVGTLHEGKNVVLVTLVSHDAVGNEVTTQAHHAITLDTQAHNTVRIHDVTADNTLNYQELLAAKQTITGFVGGEDAKVNDPVLLEINGHQYSGKVVDFGRGKLGYSIDVDSSAFADNSGHVLTNVKITAMLTSHDAAGNLAIATDSHKVHIDNYAENTIKIDAVATDNVVNANENRMPTIISIVAGGDAREGDAVTIRVRGQDFDGKVINDNGQLRYEVVLPHGTLHEGKNAVVATLVSHDALGNEVTSESHRIITLDTHAQNTISLDNIATDNVINYQELSAATQRITGIVDGEDAKVGDPIQLEVNGHQYDSRVIDLGNGHLGYSIDVDSSAFANNSVHVLTDVDVHVTVTSHDVAGNLAIATDSHKVHIDNFAKNVVTTDVVASDDVVNAIENRMPTLISGIAKGLDAKAGDVVTVHVQGQTHDFSGTVVNDHGVLRYEVFVPTGVLQEGSNDVMVTLVSHDAAGNKAVAVEHRTVTLDTQAQSTVTIDSVTDDDKLNHLELDTPMQLISGKVGGDAQIGDAVIVEINHQTFNGKVIDLGGGHLGYQVPVNSTAFSDNKGNQDKNVTVSVTVISHDAVENEVITTATHDVHIDNHAAAKITVDTVAGDDKLNGAEAAKHLTEIMGTVSGDVHVGTKVQVIVNGHTYDTTVQRLPEHNNALGYKLDVLSRDLVKDPHIVARVVGEDNVHNFQKAEISHDLVVDLHAKAMLTIDPVTGDNMVNGDESKQPFTYITGKVAGDVHVNDVVYLTVNGHVLTGKVHDVGGGVLGYSIKVSTADLISDPHLTATVSTTDGAGNPATANAETTVIIDTRVDAQITIDAVTPDNTLNFAEQMHGYTIVSGTVSGEVHPGDSFTMTINGHNYSGVVEDRGNQQMGFHVPVATADLVADPHIDVTMDITDDALNHAQITAHHTVTLDADAKASITIDPVTGDDVLNKIELGQKTTVVSGTVGGDAKIDDVVHLNIGGHMVDALVVDLPNLGTLGYSIKVDTHWLQNDPHITATITTTDAAGNNATADAHSTVVIDDKIDAIVHIDPIVTDSGDEVINHDEALKQQTTVTGTVGGDVKIGDMVELTINHQTYFARVENQNGQHVFSTKVSTLDLLMDPNIHAEVTAKDDAGNIARGYDDMPVLVDTVADAGITIDSALSWQGMALPAGNRPEFVTVTGHVTPDAKFNDLVTVDVGNNNHLETHVITLPDGQLGYTLDILFQDWNNNGNITVSITTHDDHGNTATAVEHKFIDLPWVTNTYTPANTSFVIHNPPTTPGTGTAQPHQPTVHLTVDKVAGDDVLNHDEAQKGTTAIRGLVTGDVQAGDDVIVTINHVQYPGHVITIPTMPGQLAYEVDVPTSELQAHPTFDVSIKAGTATDSVQKTIAVDMDNPLQITMDKIAGDDVINAAEAQSGKTTISGTVSGEGIHDGSVVSLQVNGNTLTAVVHDDKHGHWAWSTKVSINDLHNDPHVVATVLATDDHGNQGSASASSHVVVDLSAEAGVTIDKITQDNVLNAQESLQPKIAVTGSVSGDVHPGDKVTLTVNGNEYAATVDQSHHYSVDIYTKDLLADHAIVAKVIGYDDHKNVQAASFTQNYSIDTTTTGSITINTVGGDDVINADEVKAGSVEVSGTVDGDVHLGDKVDILVDGVTVHTRVIELPHMNGQLGYKAMVSTVGLQNDPTIHVSVEGQGSALNPMHAVSDKTVTIDTQLNATIMLDDVTTDDVLNNVETQQAKTIISGYVTGDVDFGDQVTVTVNGKELVAYVKGSGGRKVFSVEASTADLLHDQNITAHVIAHDDSGNHGRIDTSKIITIDRTAVGTMGIDNVTQDNVLNHQELQGATVRVTGPLGGDVDVWDSIKLKIGGQEFNGSVDTLSNGDRVYHVDVDSHIMEVNTTFSVEVKGHDAPGNPYSKTTSHSYSVDQQADATLIVDKVTGDNHISRAESHDTVTHITGSVSGDVNDGDHIKALVNGHQYDAILHQGINGLTYDIEADTSAFRAGHNRVNVLVEAHDNHGNITPYSQTLNVTMDDPAPVKGHTVDKGNHAAMQHALHNLFDDNALSLSYAPAATGHGQATAVLSADDKAKGVLEKVDLSDLARELHEGVDIAKYIQSGGDHHLIASPAKVAHGIDTALSTPASGDLHSPTYSLDHLIAKPDQNHTH